MTYNGQPVPRGTVRFDPRGGDAAKETRPASGILQPDGTFEMKSYANRDGVLPGEYAVAVFALREYTMLASPDEKPDYAVPARYTRSDTSGLSANIAADASGPIELNFDLSD